MIIDFEKDLDWENARVTPLGRFYNSLLDLGLRQEQIFQIINAMTESGVYQEQPAWERSLISA